MAWHMHTSDLTYMKSKLDSLKFVSLSMQPTYGYYSIYIYSTFKIQILLTGCHGFFCKSSENLKIHTYYYWLSSSAIVWSLWEQTDWITEGPFDMGEDPVSLRGGPISMGVCVHVSNQYFRSVYIFRLSLKVGRGLGCGTRGCGDIGHEHAQGLKDVGRRDWRTW